MLRPWYVTDSVTDHASVADPADSTTTFLPAPPSAHYAPDSPVAPASPAVDLAAAPSIAVVVTYATVAPPAGSLDSINIYFVFGLLALAFGRGFLCPLGKKGIIMLFWLN